MLRQLETKTVETKIGGGRFEDDGQRTRDLILAREVHRVNLSSSAPKPPVRRTSTGIDAEEASRRMLSICRDEGAHAGDTVPAALEGSDFEIHRFNGALQRRFLEEIGALEDLRAAIALCVERGWLEIGPRVGACGEIETYRLTKAGLELP
jgi:hypothetical protein